MANPKALNMTHFQKLKFFSLLETISLLLLVVFAVPLKHFNGWDTGVHIMGLSMGLHFLSIYGSRYKL